jgi:AraC family transcriptional regulator
MDQLNGERDTTSLVDVFHDPTDRLRTVIGDASIMASRSTSASLGATVTVSTPPADAFGLAYWLKPVLTHEFWSEDGFVNLPQSPKAAMTIVDLRAGGNVRYDATEFDALNIYIPAEVLRSLADQIDAPQVQDLRVPDPWRTFDPFVTALEPSLLYMLDQRNDIEPLAAQHLMLSLVSHLAHRYGGMHAAPAALRGALSGVRLRHAMALLADDLSLHMPLSDIARVCQLSPSYFSTAFKRATGKSPSAWLMEQRLARAKDLLSKGDESLIGIALRCGFADQSHFTRCFTRAFGRAPGAWRRQRR